MSPNATRPVVPPLEIHPFANTTAKLELIHPSSAIDVEEEARLYDELLTNAEENASMRRFRPSGSPGPPSIFSKDIYLGDNTGNSSSLAFARDVRISGWTNVGEGNTSRSPTLKQGMGMRGGVYVVYDCVITTKEGTSIHCLKRYSAFLELYEALKKTVPRQLLPNIPPLPPKASLARFRPTFLDNRRRRLQFWLASVLLHPEIGATAAAREWVMQ